MGAVRGVCLFIRFVEIEISEWMPSDEFVCSSDLEKLRSVNGCRQDEFVCLLDLEKLRSVNGCRQMSLFVYQIWRN